MTTRLVAVALLLSVAPSVVRADPESLHQQPPPVAIVPPPPLDPPPTPRELLSLDPHTMTRLSHAHTRAVTGRAITLGGLGALVIAFGVGVPLIHGAYANGGGNSSMANAGIAVASLFGALGGSAITVGPVLWQMGASDERRLREGGYDLWASVHRRRILGGLLIGVGALGELAAIVGGGLFASGIFAGFCDECGMSKTTNNREINSGIGLIFGGTALAAVGFSIGSTYLAAAGRDRKVMVSLAPGGLRMTF